MSSLAAARADNYYYPKAWRPEHGSLNAFHGSHALGKRAKDLATDGVLVVRFEMPFNVWCAHCKGHIGRGVRFNARKKKVGMYFTTIRYEFRLKCAQCSGELVIETDPEHRGYKLVSGVEKQATLADEEQERDEDRGVERLNDASVGLHAADDPFFRLEHEREDVARAKKRARGLEAVVERQDQQFKDDYASNAALRAGFRHQKKHLQANARRAEALGLGIPLLDAADEDIVRSKATVFQRSSYAEKKRRVDGRSNTKRKNSFECFGDDKASKLHQLKKKKLEQQSRARTSTAKQQRSVPVDRVHARAKKLLARR